jgi:4-amino-4-deoxy-L-arabinose transferase-like glycosyltransferase
MRKRYIWLVLILLAAAVLRLAAIDDIPPGLTHDEADHGLDAWGVVQGVRPIYFTVGYGREPLYDYSTAVLMSFLGPTYLAGRLTAVFFSLIFIAGTYAWVRKAFNQQTALLTAAGLAVGFWPLMTSRQGLRSITLAAVLSLTTYFFWGGLSKARKEAWFGRLPAALPYFLAAGFFLGLSFYTYIPARILWAVFPALLLFLAAAGRKLLIRVWWQVGLMLVVAAVIGLPLFQYLANNPEAEERLEQLNTPLVEARNGNFQPLLENTLAGLQIITFEGDHQWRYNIPGKPLLSPAMAMLFILGLGLSFWLLARSKSLRERAAVFFCLLWLAAGLAPVLVTGPELSTTQAIGLQPVLFIFPAIALHYFLVEPKDGRFNLLVPAFFLLVMVGTIVNYFNNWANAPEVRVQYESSLAAAVDFLNEQGEGAAAISTTTPDRFHSPAAGQLLLNNPAVNLRWFNGQHSLLIPQSSGLNTLIFSGFAPLSSDLGAYGVGLRIETILPLRETDPDRPLTVYQVTSGSWLVENSARFQSDIQEPANAVVPVSFGEAAEFLGYDLQTAVVSAGQEVRLVTLWRAGRPLADGVLFVQMLDSAGRPLAQSDRLDVPSYYWVPGDIFLQLHRFTVPEGLPEGRYSLITGLYTRSDEQRLPVIIRGVTAADHLVLPPVEVAP